MGPSFKNFLKKMRPISEGFIFWWKVNPFGQHISVYLNMRVPPGFTCWPLCRKVGILCVNFTGCLASTCIFNISQLISMSMEEGQAFGLKPFANQSILSYFGTISATKPPLHNSSPHRNHSCTHKCSRTTGPFVGTDSIFIWMQFSI